MNKFKNFNALSLLQFALSNGRNNIFVLDTEVTDMYFNIFVITAPAALTVHKSQRKEHLYPQLILVYHNNSKNQRRIEIRVYVKIELITKINKISNTHTSLQNFEQHDFSS